MMSENYKDIAIKATLATRPDTTPLCFGCINYTTFFDDGNTREVRCKLNGSQSGIFMEVWYRVDEAAGRSIPQYTCDGYGKPKIQGEVDRYPLRRWDDRGVDTNASDMEGKLKTELSMKERFQDQPIYRKRKDRRR